VNAEIAQVRRDDRSYLVSSTWGGAETGRLFFWNPDTGEQFQRVLPDGIPGAYMLSAHPNGILYLGCGDGRLVAYDGQQDAFTALDSGAMHGICWGGCVTERYVLWNASCRSSAAAVAVYDLQLKKVVHIFDPLAQVVPAAHYGHSQVVMAKDHVVWGLNTPQARLVHINPANLSATNVTAPYLDGRSSVRLSRLDRDTLAVFSGGDGDERLHLVGYPGFELLEEPGCPFNGVTMHDSGFVIGRQMYRISGNEGDLWRFDIDAREWHMEIRQWAGDSKRTTLGLWRNDSGEDDIVAISLHGEAARYDPRSGERSSMRLDASGPLSCHALCAIPERQIAIGAPFINQRFFTVGLGEDAAPGRDRGRAGPGCGQINQIVWDPQTRRAILSSYSSATLLAYDPAKPSDYPRNPVILASACDRGQMRPVALVHDGRHLWMASSPAYGTLGGALCRLDPATGTFDVWRHIVRDQTPRHIAVDPVRQRLYLGTSIHADCGSASPTQSTAVLAVFDTASLEVTQEVVLRDALPHVHLMPAVTADGAALVKQSDQLMTWSPETGSWEPACASLPPGFGEVLPGPAGLLLGMTDTTIGIMQEDGDLLHYVPRIEVGGTAHLHCRGESLFWCERQTVCECSVQGWWQEKLKPANHTRS